MFLIHRLYFSFFFFNDTATTEIYPLSYTTLFRSRGPVAGIIHPVFLRACTLVLPSRADAEAPDARCSCKAYPRSEEHTSELQSRQYLVCRLLLEKKNKNNAVMMIHRSSC